MLCKNNTIRVLAIVLAILFISSCGPKPYSKLKPVVEKSPPEETVERFENLVEKHNAFGGVLLGSIIHSGSGFLAVHSGETYFITAYHVFENDSILLLQVDEITHMYSAKLHADDAIIDKNNDLAIIPVNIPEKSKIIPLEIKSENSFKNRIEVAFICNPQRFDSAIRIGIHHNEKRVIVAEFKDFSTEAEMTIVRLFKEEPSKGCSGGPVITKDGYVIGIIVRSSSLEDRIRLITPGSKILDLLSKHTSPA